MPATRSTFAYFALACTITWALAAPLAYAWLGHQAPTPSAVACAGLSAFGPTIAAAVFAAREHRLGAVFGRWRTRRRWVALALVSPLVVHVAALALYTMAGGQPDAWFHPPSKPDELAALVVFPIGEEFGWRGYALPPMMRRFGPVRGSLLVGLGWGVWHLVYSVTPQFGGFDLHAFALTVVELPLYSLLITLLFERSNRSMAVALAFHAGAHLDHIERVANVPLQAVHVAVVAIAAAIAARRLAVRYQEGRLLLGDGAVVRNAPPN